MHIPVLKDQVLDYLNPKAEENFIDCTANGGGHLMAILEKTNGKVLGIEWDEDIYQELKEKVSGKVVLVNDSYVNLKKIVEENDFSPVNGILLDLGMSSKQLSESGRGFTFQKEEPLDMRYSLEEDLTAEEIVNTWPEKDIKNILEIYGEERYAKSIAKRIVSARPLKTTLDLVKAIGGPRKKIHPATRTFQALRIAVNDELNSLQKVLPRAEEILAPGGRLVVISFHSLEDRIAKFFFKNSNLKVLTKKPVRGTPEEIKDNPRSRSAKLRAGQKE